MGRYVWAFLAFSFCSIFLIDAFQRNTPYIFESAKMAEMAYYGLEFEFQDWAWGDHYFWRLAAAVIATGFVGFLSGAIAQSNGGRTALIANIPSVLVWVGTFYFVVFSEYEIEASTGFAVISILAIPLTSWIAYTFGGIGAEVQTGSYASHTVLGIKPFHWLWAIFPLYVYSIGIVFVVAYAVGLQFFTFNDISFVATIMAVISMLPIFAWILPLYASHQILAGEAMAENHSATRGLAIAGLLVGGVLLAMLVQFVCFWIVQKLGIWWYT
ncbi:MAG: hypothetical protein IH913_03525 [Proteobacteria bacterium]|nr:hypothetical protein [Pseudomonadota bacterium]